MISLKEKVENLKTALAIFRRLGLKPEAPSLSTIMDHVRKPQGKKLMTMIRISLRLCRLQKTRLVEYSK